MFYGKLYFSLAYIVIYVSLFTGKKIAIESDNCL